MEKNTKEGRTDHDLLIRLDEKFEGFIKQYSFDMKGLQDGIALKLIEHQKILDFHQKSIDELNRIVDVVKPEETYGDYIDFKKRVETFFITVNVYRVIAGIIGGLIFFILTQVPSLLKLWGIIK